MRGNRVFTRTVKEFMFFFFFLYCDMYLISFFLIRSEVCACVLHSVFVHNHQQNFSSIWYFYWTLRRYKTNTRWSQPPPMPHRKPCLPWDKTRGMHEQGLGGVSWGMHEPRDNSPRLESGQEVMVQCSHQSRLFSLPFSVVNFCRP